MINTPELGTQVIIRSLYIHPKFHIFKVSINVLLRFLQRGALCLAALRKQQGSELGGFFIPLGVQLPFQLIKRTPELRRRIAALVYLQDHPLEADTGLQNAQRNVRRTKDAFKQFKLTGKDVVYSLIRGVFRVL